MKIRYLNRLLVAVALSLSVLPGMAQDFEYEGLWYTVVDSIAKTVKTKAGDGSSAGNEWEGELIIPATVSHGGDNYNVVNIGDFSFRATHVTSVTLPESLTSIGIQAFFRCQSLVSVHLPQSLTDIGDAAFNLCENLTAVNLPDSLKIVRGFGGCKSLTSIKLPDNLEQIWEGAFQECSGLTEITIPDKVYNIRQYAFAECYGLQSISMPESVEYIGIYAFENCNLISVSLPSSLENIQYRAFKGCSMLNEVTYLASNPIAGASDIFDDSVYENAILKMPHASLESIQAQTPWNLFKNIEPREGLGAGDDFEYEGLWYTVIDPEAKTCRTKRGDYQAVGDRWIAGNSQSGDLVIPQKAVYGGTEYDVVSIGWYGFYATDLTSVSLPEGLRSIEGSAFKECHNLASVNIPETVEEIGIVAFAQCAELKSVKLPDAITTLELGIFADCENLEEVILPKNLETIKGTIFQCCHKLQEIELPQSLRYIGTASFNQCDIKSLRLPEGIDSIGEASFQMNALKEIIIPRGIQSFGGFAFYDSRETDTVTYEAALPVAADLSLFSYPVYDNATLNMPNAMLADIMATTPWNQFKHINAKDGSVAPGLEAGSDFEYEGLWYTVLDAETGTCKTKDGEPNYYDQIFPPGNNVEGELVIPEIVSDGSKNYSVVEIGEWGFSNTKITSLTLPESVTKVGGDAFYECVELASISLPENLKTISNGAFINCDKLKSVHIPDGLTQLAVQAFAYCDSLAVVNIPTSISELEYGVFMGCWNLSSIEIPDNIEIIGADAFSVCPLKSVTIPANVKEIGWRAFWDYSPMDEVTYNAATPVELIVVGPNGEDIFYDETYEKATLRMPNATLASVQATVPWNKFKHIIAMDGSVVPGLEAGTDFEYEGLWYTVIDAEAKTVRTRAGQQSNGGNYAEGDLVLPSAVSDGTDSYSVVAIGESGFSYNPYLTSVTMPESIVNVDAEAFSGCERLTSLVWHGKNRMPEETVVSAGNPNLIVYADRAEYAPAVGNVAVAVNDSVYMCESLVLTQGSPIRPLLPFTAKHTELTKDYTQKTPITIDGCAGWETIVLPFDAKSIVSHSGTMGDRELTPFAAVTNVRTQYPFWLYEADAEGRWKEATEIKAGVPYIVSMPNNAAYDERYNVAGEVRYSCDEPTAISMATTAPQYVTWTSGRKFESLWMPISDDTPDVMGLNVGNPYLVGDDGEKLLPGSAFHVGVTPKPLEAYVTRTGGERAMKVFGGQSGVPSLMTGGGLDILTDKGEIRLVSATDQKVVIYNTQGIAVKTLDLRAGEPTIVSGLTRDIYIIAGRKVTVK